MNYTGTDIFWATLSGFLVGLAISAEFAERRLRKRRERGREKLAGWR